MKLDEGYWQGRYEENRTGWDIGYAGPLAHILSLEKSKEVNILLPGAGNAYEAEWAWGKGFKKLTVLDLAKSPLDNLKARVPYFPAAQIVHGDFFKHQGAYDIILEQTFFCALNPELRKDYVKQMNQLLKSGGVLTGVLFDFPLDSGPPFGGSEEEYVNLFSPTFEIEKMERCSFSIAPRAGKELYFRCRKK